MHPQQHNREKAMAQLARRLFPAPAAVVDARVLAPKDAAERNAEMWIAQQSELLLAEPKAPSAAVSQLSSATRAALTQATEMFGPLGLQVPEAEAFQLAGVPLQLLAHPGPIPCNTAIVPAPHRLGMQVWIELFAAANDTDNKAPELSFAAEVQRWFDALDAPPSVPCPQLQRPVDGFGHQRNVVWTLRAIPELNAPETLGVPYGEGPHPTLPEMLTLQLLRQVRREPLLDAHTATWLDGQLPDPKFSARHTYDQFQHCLRITTREKTDRGSHAGIRTPRV